MNINAPQETQTIKPQKRQNIYRSLVFKLAFTNLFY